MKYTPKYYEGVAEEEIHAEAEEVYEKLQKIKKKLKLNT